MNGKIFRKVKPAGTKNPRDRNIPFKAFVKAESARSKKYG
jgi:hypothetical protein